MRNRITLISLTLFFVIGVWLIPSRAELSARPRKSAAVQQQPVAPVFAKAVRFAESPAASAFPAPSNAVDATLMEHNLEPSEINELNVEQVRTAHMDIP